MRNIFLLIICFLLYGCFHSNKESSILFKNEVFNFKKQVSGNVVEAIFTVKNITRKDIIVTNISTDCHCLSSDKQVIKAGSSQNLKISFDTKGLVGLQKREVIIRFNKEPFLQSLWIVGEIIK